jgi:hypothetical protein
MGDAERVEWDEADRHLGERVKVCGPLADLGHDSDDTFLNVGAPYPSSDRFVVVLWQQADVDLVVDDGYEVCALGEVSRYQGVAQIEVWEEDHWTAVTYEEISYREEFG